MSLQNVILPDVLIAELYKNVFVLNETVAESQEPEVGSQESGVGTWKTEVRSLKSEAGKLESDVYEDAAIDKIVGDTDASEVIVANDKVAKDPVPNTIKFLGNNVKNILILVRYPHDVFLPERHLEFLIKLLAACKLNIGDIAIVNDGHTTVDIHSLQQQLKPKKIILFGIGPIEIKLPLNFPNFKLQSYASSVYLSVPSLDILNHTTEDKLLKTKLWVCLKTMFEVD